MTDGGRVVDASEKQEVSIFSIILKFIFYNGRFLLHNLEGWQLVKFAAGCFKQPWLFTKEVWRWMFVTTVFLTWILPSHLVSQSASERKCHWTCVVWMSWGVIQLFLFEQICLIRSGSLRPWLLWAKNQSRQDLVPVVHGPSIGEEDGQGRSDRMPVLMCRLLASHSFDSKGLIEAIRV